MKKLITIFLLLVIASPVLARGELELFAYTDDGVKIAFDYYPTGHNEVLIIAPGWFMTKDTKQFENISFEFSKSYDVICMDFRGHGRSGGKFSFGSQEVYDIKAVIKALGTKYKKVYLMGFSLGAMSSILYCSSNSGVDKLISVSPPSDFAKIENSMWKKEAYIPTIQKFFSNLHYMEFPKKIRPGNYFSQKLKPKDVVEKIKIPHLIIAGEKDPTIYPWHAWDLYLRSTNASLEIFQNNYHAEDIYIANPLLFVKTCKDWLDRP